MKHYIYKTTNLITKKYYIGKHSSQNIENDNYLGSGLLLNRAIKRYGRENFIRQILYQFESQNQAFDKEAELITEQMITSNDCYNSCVGGVGGRNNMVSVKDQFGNHFTVLKTDNRYTSGQLKFNCYGMVYVVDENGRHKQIERTEYQNNKHKYTHVSKGNVVVRDKEGNTFCTTIDDPNYTSGKLKHINTGRVAVKDANGNKFQVFKNDNRLSTKQLLGVNVGKKYIHNNSGASKMISLQQPIPQGWLQGLGFSTTSHLIWIFNQVINKELRVSKDQLEEYILKGWKQGRLTNRGGTSHNKGKKLFINKEGKREYI